MPKEITTNFIRERQISPKKCSRGSFRTKAVSKKTKIIVCCPKGHYNQKTKRCRKGMVLQSKLTKRGKNGR